jgi:glutathione S-transferase
MRAHCACRRWVRGKLKGMLQVLGRLASINVRKVLWTCHELDLPHELQQWGTGELKLDSTEFKALNPNGLVPVIRDGDFVLWESNTICRYLAAAARREDLLPDAAAPRAGVEQWMDWASTQLNNAYLYAFLGLVRRNPNNQDPRLIAASLANWNTQMALLEARLQATAAYVAGAHFTLADIVIGLAVHRWYHTPAERPDLAAVAEYYRRVSARPAFTAHGSVGQP